MTVRFNREERPIMGCIVSWIVRAERASPCTDQVGEQTASHRRQCEEKIAPGRARRKLRN
jgi:hypothetical protein